MIDVPVNIASCACLAPTELAIVRNLTATATRVMKAIPNKNHSDSPICFAITISHMDYQPRFVRTLLLLFLEPQSDFCH